MNNKLNYLLVPLVIILLIGSIFVYSNLNRQNADIKKDISELKGKLNRQQENTENLQNLVTFNWKTYQNDQFGFSFKYPEYTDICDETAKVGVELNLVIHQGVCDKKNFNAPLAQLKIKKNIANYKTAEEAFYAEEQFSTKSLNPQLNSFKINKFDAYGGKVIYEINEAKKKYTVTINVVILKDNYIIELVGNPYIETADNSHVAENSIINAIFSSLHFF